MKSLNYLVLFALAIGITVTTCKNDTLTPKEMLTAKSWKLVSNKVNGVESIEYCSKDDILTFAVNSTYSMIVGSIICNEGEKNYAGTWILSDDGKTIVVDSAPASIAIAKSKLVVTVVDGSDSMEKTLIPE